MRRMVLLLGLVALLTVSACTAESDDPDTQGQSVTRGEFAALALDCYYAIGGEAPVEEDEVFADCDDAAVTTALNLGLVTGDSDGMFQPEETVTRQQAAVILRNVLTAAEVELPGLCGTTFANLTDADQVDPSARDSVSILVNLGVFRDVITDNAFHPDRGLSQEEADVLAAQFRSAVHSFTGAEGESFAGQLTAALAEEENLVLSPVSLQMALGLLEPGASGETLTQLSRLLAGTDLAAWQETLTQTTENGPTVEVANSLWLDTSVTPSEDYLRTLRTVYDAESTTLDLETAKAMKTINAWVNDKTHGLIQSLLDEPLSEDAAVVLLNTIYFSGEWVSAFDPNCTRDGSFYTATGEVTVPFLHDTRHDLDYIDTDTCVGAALPYQGDGNWWLLCLLPKEGRTPAQLAEEDFGALLEGRQAQAVNLSLPKFTLEGTYYLADALQDLGLTAPFDPAQADFSPMGTSQQGPLVLSQVLQKTYLRVDEKGTEAAAVTGAVAEPASALPDQLIDLTFDQPFLCCLWNAAIGQPLFLAVVDDPS